MRRSNIHFSRRQVLSYVDSLFRLYKIILGLNYWLYVHLVYLQLFVLFLALSLVGFAQLVICPCIRCDWIDLRCIIFPHMRWIYSCIVIFCGLRHFVCVILYIQFLLFLVAYTLCIFVNLRAPCVYGLWRVAFVGLCIPMRCIFIFLAADYYSFLHSLDIFFLRKLLEVA